MILINKWALNFKNHYFWQCATISSSASRSPSPTLRSLWFVWMSSFTAIGKTPAFTICQYENKWTLNFECHMTTPLLLDKPYHTRSASLAFCQPKCYICTCICYIQHLNFLCLDWNIYFYLQENLKQLDGIFSPSGIGKTTSVVFTLQNRVGNLANALKIFQVKNPNTSPPHILYLYQNSKDIEHNLGYIQCLFPTLLKSNSLY